MAGEYCLHLAERVALHSKLPRLQRRSRYGLVPAGPRGRVEAGGADRRSLVRHHAARAGRARHAAHRPTGRRSALGGRPQRGTFGTVGRNRLDGPSFSQWDVSFFKNFVVTGSVRAQFRAEAFNILNKVNLANPNTCVDCPGTAGRITNIFQLATMRQWQFGLRLEF